MNYRPLDVLLDERGVIGKGIDVERIIKDGKAQIDSANGHPGPVRLNYDGLLFTLEYRGLCSDETRDQMKQVVNALKDYASSRKLGFHVTEARTMRKDWNPIALEFYGR